MFWMRIGWKNYKLKCSSKNLKNQKNESHSASETEANKDLSLQECQWRDAMRYIN